MLAVAKRNICTHSGGQLRELGSATLMKRTRWIVVLVIWWERLRDSIGKSIFYAKHPTMKVVAGSRVAWVAVVAVRRVC